MKRILIATVLALGLTTAGGFAYIHGNGGGVEFGGHGKGQGMIDEYENNDGGYYHPAAACAGRSGWSGEQKQKFLDDTVELRKEMYDKRFEYKEALKNPTNTSQQLSKMEKEIIDLRDKIYDKAPQNLEAKQNGLAAVARNDKRPDPQIKVILGQQ